MDEQTEMELGHEAQCLDQENQREQLLAKTQEWNKQLQAENKKLKKNEKAIFWRIQYSLEKLGKEATLLLIEQALK